MIEHSDSSHGPPGMGNKINNWQMRIDVIQLTNVFVIL